MEYDLEIGEEAMMIWKYMGILEDSSNGDGPDTETAQRRWVGNPCLNCLRQERELTKICKQKMQLESN